MTVGTVDYQSVLCQLIYLDLHDEVAVAEEGRLGGGAVLVGSVVKVQRAVGIARQVAHDVPVAKQA